jgi:hypothetical protein
MNRRTLLKTGGMAAAGGLTIGVSGCDEKDVDFYIATVTGSMTQLKQFLPNQAALIDRAISIAKSVNSAYQDGKFDSALSLANNLTTTIDEIITAAGINLSDTVKMILSIANVALGTIAVLIANSGPSTVAASSAQKVKSMASSQRVNAIFQASRL